MTDSNQSQEGCLPGITLTAAGSGREISLAQIGVPAILVFHGQDTADTALEVNRAVRGRHPGADEVFIASVIDLRSFPSMFRSMVQPALEKAYFNSAGKVPPEADPADLVVLLPDWDGAVHEAVGITGSTEKAAVVVVDAAANILFKDQGDDPAGAALNALAEIL